MNLFDKYYREIKTFWFWQYQPADERERQLYLQAYARIFWVLLFGLLVTVSVVHMFGAHFVEMPKILEPFLTYQTLEAWLIILLIVAFSSGSIPLRNQGLSLKKDITYKWVYWLVGVNIGLFILFKLLNYLGL